MGRINNKITPANLNRLKQLIQQARMNYEIAQQSEDEVFEYLEKLGVGEPSDISCAAPNATNLLEAITCYLNYGEWSVKHIIDAIASNYNMIED